tara:strand:+ start:2981 stop:5209 length:2229 start_codon:yes stop_codon:yes gene_type:complete
MKKFLILGFALALGSCGSMVSNKQDDFSNVKTDTTIDPQSPYVEMCSTAKGSTAKLNAVDRDQWGTVGLDLEAMDSRYKAGDDFFCYVNGLWYSNFNMPEDKTSYGSFTLLRDKSEARVKVIIEELSKAEPDASTLEGKVAIYYNAFNNADAIEAAGMSPAQPYLDQINAISNLDDLAKVFSAAGFSSPIGGWVDVDSKDTENYIFHVTQSGLGLPDRDMYLTDEGKNIETRQGYLKYLTLLLREAGYENPNKAAMGVLALETEIAKAHWDRTVGRNRDLTYNKMSQADLVLLGGNFPVKTMLEGLNISNQEQFVVRQVTPDADEIDELGLTKEQVSKISGGGIKGIMDVMASADLNDWKAYLIAHFLSDHASVLPQKIDNASFAFYAKQLRGQEEQRPRWKRAVGATEGALGEAIGKVYAARYFPAENKLAMDQLVGNLRKAMADNLDKLDWMGVGTKLEAHDKLTKFTPKIGYTEKFETYDTMTVGHVAFDNVMSSSSWAYDDMIGQLGNPIDKTEWFMLPQTVNAYYSPSRNEIVFPAGILQPPFFNINADPVVNYGAIGAVIGHEIGHGFDDQGAKSDGNGLLRNWWTQSDNEAFVAKTDALVGQYNKFCPLDDGKTCVNGRFNLGENTGDLGGLSMAYKAYKMSLDIDGNGEISTSEQAPVIDGYTGDQRFFLAYAQAWRAKYRPETLRQQLISDPHSPPYYRVNGIVRNFDEWYQAFNIGPENALYLPPEERIRIW